LDFDADFTLSSTDIVEGIEITFLAPDGDIDFSGAYIIQGALTPIRKVPNTELVQIAPNPASSTIQVLNLSPPFSYSIYNNLGQPIKQNTITTSNTLNIGNLPASFYYLYIENENHEILVHTIKHRLSFLKPVYTSISESIKNNS
jgi:hypothetical protein